MKRVAKMNKQGVTPPQQGRIARVPSKPMDVTAGQAPQHSANQGAPLKGIRAGAPPADTSPKHTTGETVRSGASPFQGKVGASKGNAGVITAGAAPVSNMTPPGAGKAPSDVEQNYMDTGRRYAKGGRVSEEQSESKAERAREAKNPALEAAEGRHAAGGRVNRHGSGDRVPMPGGSTVGAPGPANGGNGGVAGGGGNAAIPLAQPGGTPSTGIVASGRMQPSFAGADTNGLTPDGGGKLRSAPVTRAGGMPSLPRPRRGK